MSTVTISHDATIPQVVTSPVTINDPAVVAAGVLGFTLTERGYVKFQLTRAQARRLKKLEAGSLERRAYLYRLTSDPKVLEAQAMPGS